jgi:hypothetical protein
MELHKITKGCTAGRQTTDALESNSGAFPRVRLATHRRCEDPTCAGNSSQYESPLFIGCHKSTVVSWLTGGIARADAIMGHTHRKRSERSKSMIVTRLTHRVLLVLVCCLAIISLPLTAGAQGILKKGVEGVKKGVETGAEKTKEGAEAVGHGVKKAVTGEDTNTSRMKSSETKPNTEPSQATRPSEPATRSQTVTPSEKTTGESSRRSTDTGRAARGGERLPGTAAELPLLALIGVLALAAAGTSKLIRRVRVMK